MIEPAVQSAEQPVDVSGWSGHEDYERMYPEGTREKRLLVCPHPVPHDFLIPGHRYLFKKSVARYPDQFWTEVIAHRIGLLAGVPVPPAFVACDTLTGECAALIEWFYGYPGVRTRRYIRGGEFMMSLIPGYDIKRGEQHSFEAIQRVARSFEGHLNSKDWHLHWAQVFAFDALIGNVDRHQDNWGIVVEFTGNGPVRFYWSPAFDNGTSMGHNYFPARLTTMLADPGQFDRFLTRGMHHAKWSSADIARLSHADFLVRYCREFPDARRTMLDCLSFSDAALEEAVMPLVGFAVAVPLNLVRARFVVTLLRHRRDRLAARLASLP